MSEEMDTYQNIDLKFTLESGVSKVTTATSFLTSYLKLVPSKETKKKKKKIKNLVSLTLLTHSINSLVTCITSVTTTDLSRRSMLKNHVYL